MSLFGGVGVGYSQLDNCGPTRSDGSGTADGGKVSRLDRLVDAAGPVTRPISAKAVAEMKRRDAEMKKVMPHSYDPALEGEIHRLRAQEAKNEAEAKSDARARDAKRFVVTPETRFGGTGLFGEKE